jgi:PAS domain S-box-containing protein
MDVRPQTRGGSGTIQLVDLLEFAIEQTSDGIAIMRFTGDPDVPIRIVYANGAIERLSGYTREELLDPSNPLLRVQTGNRAQYDAYLKDVRAGNPVRFRIEFHGKQKPVWCDILWSPLRFKGGEITHYVAVLRDIGERDDRTAIVESMLSQTSDFVVTADSSPPSQGGPHITYANPAFGAIAAIDAHELAGRPLTEFFSSDNERVLLENITERLERQQSISVELQIRRAGGADLWVELSGNQVRGENARAASWLFLGKDISLRKQGYMQTAQLLTALDLAQEPISIYTVKDVLQLELEHRNESADAADARLLEKMLANPFQRNRIRNAWPALEGNRGVMRLTCGGQGSAKRWVTLHLRPMMAGERLTSLITIESALRVSSSLGHRDEVATMLALSREILGFEHLEDRRDALMEVLREEMHASASFSRTSRAGDVVLRVKDNNGYVVMPPGVFFERAVAVDLYWSGMIPSRRLTAFRIFLETLARPD